MNENVERVAPRSPRIPSSEQPYVVDHDFDGTAEFTTTIIHAISDVTGVDPTDAGLRLYDHVDPDALNRLFKPRSDGSKRFNCTLTFTVWGCWVSIHSSGRITVVPHQ